MAAGTATASRGLTAEERRVMEELLKRGGFVAKPVQKVGSTYQALINLCQPRFGDPDKQGDLIMAGETVILTDDEAALWLPPNKPFPYIRRAAEASDPQPHIPPRAVSGPRRTPANARPDPAGSTTIQVVEDVVPEANPPKLGSQNTPGASDDGDDATRQQIQDAIDIKVRR